MIWITLPYACFGLVHDGAVIRRAPPIARWTVGKPVAAVIAYYRRQRGARVEMIGD